MRRPWNQPTVLLQRRPRRNRILVTILFLGDFFLISSAFWLAYLVRFQLLDYPAPYDPVYYAQIIVINSVAWIGLFWVHQLYSPKILFGGIDEYSRVFNAVTLGVILLVFIDFIWNRDLETSRGWLIFVWILSLILVESFRFLMRHAIYAIHRRGHLLVSALIVNADEEGQALLDQLTHFPHSGLRVRGFIDNRLPRGTLVKGNYPVLGTIDELMEVVATHAIEEVIVASGAVGRDELLSIYRSIAWNHGVKLRLTSGLFEIMSTSLHIKELVNIPLIEVNKVRITGLNQVMKTITDFAIACFGLLLLSPIFILIAILIRLDSSGPVLYKHLVMGLNGKQFLAYKFRTMFTNGDEIFKANPDLHKKFSENYKLIDDPRVTRFGRFLRRISLDELPQLINILQGQMSLVGPRFITPQEMDKFGKWGMNLLTVKPGMTGLWQISGRSDTSYDERVRLDMYYIRNWSLWLDVYILLMTLPVVLTGKALINMTSLRWYRKKRPIRIKLVKLPDRK